MHLRADAPFLRFDQLAFGGIDYTRRFLWDRS